MKKIKIKKELPKWIRVTILILILILFLTLNVIYLCEIDSEKKVALLIIAIALEFIGLAYFIIQDIISIQKIAEKKIFFQNDGVENDFKFVDRKIILDSIDNQVDAIIKTKRKKRFQNCIIMEMESKSGNGKKTLCKKIVNKMYFYPQIKYTDFVDISNDDDIYNYFKTHTFIRFKLNVVVINMRFDLKNIIKEIKDKDIIFIIIAHSNNQGSIKLDLSADDVCELLTCKQKNRLFDENKKEAESIIKITKNINDILIIIKNGGAIYCNNRVFIQFYSLINNMHYYEALDYYKQNINNAFQNSLGKLKATYEYANILHFTGKYLISKEILESLRVQLSESDPEELKILKDVINLLAHVNKHIGEFKYAFELLNNNQYLYTNELTYNKSFFSILIFCYNQSFLDTRYKNSANYLEELEKKFNVFAKQRNKKNEVYYFYETYYPVYNCYKNNFSKDSLNISLTLIDDAINYYEKNYRRFLTNCYFLKAEIYRHIGEWQNAKEYYLKCLEIYRNNNDKDILYMLSITFEMINIFYDAPIKDIPFELNFEYCLNECSKNDQYNFHNQLFYYIQQYKNGNGTYMFLKDYFLKIINPIP